MSKADEASMGVAPQQPSDQTASSSGVQMPMPILPEYVEISAPPPSYEEIMGHQTQTSVNSQNTTDLPPLAYVDIMPRMLNPGNMRSKIAPQFDKFG